MSIDTVMRHAKLLVNKALQDRCCLFVGESALRIERAIKTILEDKALFYKIRGHEFIIDKTGRIELHHIRDENLTEKLRGASFDYVLVDEPYEQNKEYVKSIICPSHEIHTAPITKDKNMNATELDEILTVLRKHKVLSAKIGENEFHLEQQFSLTDAPQEQGETKVTGGDLDRFGHATVAESAGF